MRYIYFIHRDDYPASTHRSTLHTHNFEELLYCCEGKSIQHCDSSFEECKKGNLFFFPAGSSHCTQLIADEPFSCYVIGFSKSLFSQQIDPDCTVLTIIEGLSKCKGNALSLSAQNQNSTEKLLIEVLGEFGQGEAGFDAMIKAQLSRILVKLLRDKQIDSASFGISTPDATERIEMVLTYLDNYYMHSVSIDKLLQIAKLSRSHFHARFKELTGKTLTTYLNELRIKKAAELIKNSLQPINEIGFQCGFNSHSRFCRTFRKYKGLSASEFRKSFSETE